MNDIYLIRKLDQAIDIIADCQDELKNQQSNGISVSSNVVMSFTKDVICVNGIQLFNYPSIEHEVMRVLLKHYLSDMINETATQLNSLQIINLCKHLITEDDVYQSLYRIRKKIKRTVEMPIIVKDKMGYFISPYVSIKRTPKN